MILETLETQQLNDTAAAAIIKICCGEDNINPTLKGIPVTADTLYSVVTANFFTGVTKELFSLMKRLYKNLGEVPTANYIFQTIKEEYKKETAEALCSDLSVNIKTDIKLDGEELGSCISTYCNIASIDHAIQLIATEADLFKATHSGKGGYYIGGDVIFDKLREKIREHISLIAQNPFDKTTVMDTDCANDTTVSAISNSMLSSGNPYIDALLYGGWEKGNFIVNLAGTGVGKTTLFENLIVGSARQGRNVCVVSAEQPKDIYIRHIYSIVTGHDRYDKSELRIKLPESFGRIEVIKCPYGTDYNLISGYLKKIEKDGGVKFDVVFIDYIGALKGGDASGSGMYSSGKIIAQKMAEDAKENDWVVVTATQANRVVKDNDIDLSCMAESSAIAHTADLVLGVYRNSITDTTVLKCLKNRGGATGKNTKFEMVYIEKTGEYLPAYKEEIDGFTRTQNTILLSYFEERKNEILSEAKENSEIKSILD